MKHLKKIVTATMVITMLAASATPTYARGIGGGCCRGRGIQSQNRVAPQAHRYFNAYGTEVTFQPRNLWQDDDGNVMFGRGCWFLDAGGNVVNAWNSQVFDADGNAVVWGGAGWGYCCALFWGE